MRPTSIPHCAHSVHSVLINMASHELGHVRQRINVYFWYFPVFFFCALWHIVLLWHFWVRTILGGGFWIFFCFCFVFLAFFVLHYSVCSRILWLLGVPGDILWYFRPIKPWYILCFILVFVPVFLFWYYFLFFLVFCSGCFILVFSYVIFVLLFSYDILFLSLVLVCAGTSFWSFVL